MATFNKRGYKEPKPKAEKLDNNYIEDVNVDAKDSATAKAFDTLDQSASRAEDFVAKNQKYILGFLTVVALATVSYLLYQKFIAEPSQEEAANELFVAQQNFQMRNWLTRSLSHPPRDLEAFDFSQFMDPEGVQIWLTSD